MNYLAEIRHFYDWLETESLPSNAIVLWHALMFTANRCGWREEFSVPFSVLENRTKLDKSTICRMRRILVERGVISVRGQRGRRSAIYRLNPFERHPAEHDATVSATQIHRMTGKALQSATPTATVSIQDRIIPEKEKTSKKEKALRRREERKGCAEKREPIRQNLSQFLASLDEIWRAPMSIWLEYKRSRREGYRSEMGARKCLALLRDLSGDDPAVAAAVIDRSIAKIGRDCSRCGRAILPRRHGPEIPAMCCILQRRSMPVVFWKSSTAAPSETMTSFPTYRMPYIHPAKCLVMEPLATIIDRLSAEKRLVVRRAESLSWGDRERSEALFREIFRRVDRTVVRYRPLPEYASVIGWMTATDGRGLLLWGDCGRGKSTILTGVIPVLLAMKGFHACPVHADELTQPYRFAASTAGCDPTCSNLDFLTRTPFPIIDEVGVEPLINDYGERYEGFNRIVNAAERRLRPLFLATNLSKEQLLRRYGERTFDRLTRLCRAVEFRGESLR